MASAGAGADESRTSPSTTNEQATKRRAAEGTAHQPEAKRAKGESLDEEEKEKAIILACLSHNLDEIYRLLNEDAGRLTDEFVVHLCALVAARGGRVDILHLLPELDVDCRGLWLVYTPHSRFTIESRCNILRDVVDAKSTAVQYSFPWRHTNTFREACVGGHMAAVKFAQRLTTETSPTIGKQTFFAACANGHLDVIDFLLLHPPRDVVLTILDGVQSACQARNMRTFDYLFPRTETADLPKSFVSACGGSLAMVEKVLGTVKQLKLPLARQQRQEGLEVACKKHNMEVINFLLATKQLEPLSAHRIKCCLRKLPLDLRMSLSCRLLVAVWGEECKRRVADRRGKRPRVQPVEPRAVPWQLKAARRLSRAALAELCCQLGDTPH